MPGLIGIAQKTLEQNIRSVFGAGLTVMQREKRLQSESRIAHDDRWALGRVHLGVLQPTPQLTESDEVHVLLHGDLYNEAELRTLLRSEGAPSSGQGIGALLTALYRLYGRSFASRMQGAFCIVVLDERQKQLVLVNDCLGSYFLFWFNGPQRFIFASQLKAVLCDPEAKPTLNPRAVADYITFGCPFGEKTLAAQVQLLPPASTLTYCWEDGNCTIERYWRVDAAFSTWEDGKPAYLEDVRHAFNQAVQRSLIGEYPFGMSLSGGLDSRAILSAIDCTRTPISTYTLGAKGCADEVIAAKLSRIAGTTHQFLELDINYLNEGLINLQRMVTLTDGMYLTHGLTEILALQLLEEANFSVLLRGHGGELAKASLAWPLHTDERIYAMQSKDEFVSYMMERVNYISGNITLSDLFTEEWSAQIEGGARRSLEESIADVRLSPPDLCSYLYLAELHRRFTLASLELFRNFVEVRMPFVDQDFLQLLFRCPARWRDKTDIHRILIGTNNPALLKVRNSNTGAPGDANPFVEKILDKANSLLKRLNLRGYRHYHSFDRWMKQTLLNSVEQVLLHPESLARGIYRGATLRQLMEETRQGKVDHAYLLQVLLILELWQRENL